jgi:hypothetical protein
VESVLPDAANDTHIFPSSSSSKTSLNGAGHASLGQSSFDAGFSGALSSNGTATSLAGMVMCVCVYVYACACEHVSMFAYLLSN